MNFKTDLESIPKTEPPDKLKLKFWTAKYVTEVTKEGAIKKPTGFNIDRVKFLNLLFDLGFRRYDHAGAHIFVQIINHRIIRQVSKINIADAFFNYIKKDYGTTELVQGLYVEDLINSIYGRLQALFNDEFLARLVDTDKPIDFNKDTNTKKYLYFKNGFVEVSKSGFKFLDYENLQGYIWETELLNRNFKPADAKESYFEKFLNCICKKDKDRLKSLQTIIGYNLHDYAQKKLRATVLTDSKISNDDEPNGRTGKTLFCKALGQIISPDCENTANTTWVEINGKDFDPRNKNKYQVASIDTKMIVLNDVRRGFDIEVLFNDITEGLTVERKNQHPFKIRPRLIITTNKTIKIEGESGKDRFIEFEFSDYFSKARSPEDEFKHWFFRDWNQDEFNSFDCFMILCTQLYLYYGLIEAKGINLLERKLREQTSPEFIEWIDLPLVQAAINRSCNLGEQISKNEWFADFTGTYPDYANKLKQATFSRWIKTYCQYSEKGLSFDTKFAGKDKGHVLIFKKK